MVRFNIHPTPMWGSVPLVAVALALIAEWSDSVWMWYNHTSMLSSYHELMLWVAPVGIIAIIVAIRSLVYAEARYTTNETELM